MISFLLMLACSTEVGLLGYTDKQQDTNESVVDSWGAIGQVREPHQSICHLRR